jgi:hypothetical protein
VARDSSLALVHELTELRPESRALVLVPLIQFERDAATVEPQVQPVIRAIS